MEISCSLSSCPVLWTRLNGLYGCMDAWTVYQRLVMKRGKTGQKTGSSLLPLEVICLPHWFQSWSFYQFNAQAAFIISLPWGWASLQQNKCVLCFCQRGRGVSAWPAKPFSSQSDPLFGSSLCSVFTEREGASIGGGRRRAGVSLGARGLHSS